jgi:hypothetical protein
LGSYFGGAKSNSFHPTCPSLSISGGDDPFSASLSATPTMSGALNFNSGYFGALNPSTVSLASNPSLPMSGQVGVDLGRASAGASTTVDFAPGAALALFTGHASFSSTKQHPVVTTQMPSG